MRSEKPYITECVEQVDERATDLFEYTNGRYIYVSKKLHDEFLAAVESGKWIYVNLVTTTSFADYNDKEPVLVRSLRYIKEKKNVVKYAMNFAVPYRICKSNYSNYRGQAKAIKQIEITQAHH